MSKIDTTVLHNGQLAVATVEQSGTIVATGGEIDATALVQTENGKQLCVKTYPLNGGGGGYTLPPATADTLGGIKVGQTLTVEADGTLNTAGGGGTSDYADLSNKPSINSVTLSGNKTSTDLGLASNDLSNVTVDAQRNVVETLNGLYHTVGYTVIGSPTISSGVVSGFSSSSYITLKTAKPSCTSFEKQIKFTTGNVDSFQSLLGSLTTNMWDGIYIRNDGTMNVAFLKSNETVQDNVVNYALSANTTYTIQVKFSDSKLYVYIYDSAGTQVHTQTFNVTDTNPQVTSVAFGIRYSNTSVFTGSIDLNNTYIKVDGKYFFIGRAQEVNPAHLAMPSDTYVNLTVAASGTAYQAPADGYLCGGASSEVQFSTYPDNNPSTPFVITVRAANTSSSPRIICPVSKGQWFKFTYDGSSVFCKFTYAKGAESEYTPS